LATTINAMLKYGFHIFLFSLPSRVTLKFWLPYGYMMPVKKWLVVSYKPLIYIHCHYAIYNKVHKKGDLVCIYF
jgi:hypothetical protein